MPSNSKKRKTKKERKRKREKEKKYSYIVVMVLGKEQQIYVFCPKFNPLINTEIPSFSARRSFVESSGFMNFVCPTGQIQTDPV